MDASEEAVNNADHLIEVLKQHHNVDYTAVRLELAEQIWYNGHWEGNWDVTTDLPEGHRNLRAIQEDEYDQHMDEDDGAPLWDDMLASNPVYVWFA